MPSQHYSGRQMNPRGPQSGRGTRQGSGESAPPREFPRPREVVYREDGRFKSALVDEEARKRAEELKELAPTQLRRFFDTVKAIERQIDLRRGQGESSNNAFKAVWPQFAMLKAQAAYAKGRLKGKMPDAFVQFIVDHVHAVSGNSEHFEDFVRHFEAVVAFHKYYGKEEKS